MIARWPLRCCPLLLAGFMALAGPFAQADSDLDAKLAEAKAYKEKHKYGKAIEAYEEALERAKTVWSDKPLWIAIVYYNCGTACWMDHNYRKAQGHFQASLILRQKNLPSNALEIAETHNYLGMVSRALGSYRTAAQHYRAALDIAEQRSNASLQATYLSNLGYLSWMQGEYQQARAHYRQSLLIANKLADSGLDPDYVRLGLSWNNLAYLEQSLGSYDKAQEDYANALQCWRGRKGTSYYQATVECSLGDLCLLQASRAQLDAADRHYQRCRQILRDAGFEDGNDLDAACLNNQGFLDLLLDPPNYLAAAQHFKESHDLFERRFEGEHLYVAISERNQGQLALRQGHFEEARRLLEQSLAIMEKRFGKNNPHPDLARVVKYLAEANAAEGNSDRAAQLMDRARHLFREHESQVLPTLPEAQQINFLNTTDALSFHQALSLALLKRQDPHLAELSAGWVLNGKAMVQQTLAENHLLERFKKDPSTAALVEKLREARSNLAAAVRGNAAPDLADAAREQELSAQLGLCSSTKVWVDLAQVRKAIDPGAVLIEMAKVSIWKFQTRKEQDWAEPRYVAWIIPAAGEGEVQVLDLGPARPIDEAIEEVRKQIRTVQTILHKDPNSFIKLTDPEKEKEFKRPLAGVAKLVLPPLMAATSSKQWLVSPDDQLWLVPWAALPLNDVRYAIEDYDISYVVSGRDLVQPRPQVQPEPSLVMAEPNYDLAPPQADRGENKSEAVRLLGELGAHFNPLEGTAASAEIICNLLRSREDPRPRLLLGAKASEANFVAAPRPRVLVLSTHGYFQPSPSDRAGRFLPGDWDERLAGRAADSRANPLQRCGLALAGANQARKVANSEHDGILTGQEVLSCDLRGTDLVVLSACETGIGAVQKTGEGVTGLRQAFHLAGARTVVASLWEVPNTETTFLMEGFFKQLPKNPRNKAWALREAQLALIRSHRDPKEGYGSANPFFWAAFTLTGEHARLR